MLACTVMRTSC